MEKEGYDHVGPGYDDDGDDDYDVYGEIGNSFVQFIRMIEYGILRT